MTEQIFSCDSCGLCCQSVNHSPFTKHLDRGDGTCRFYDHSTKLCSIYETRPIYCRVKEGYSVFGNGMSLSEYYRQNMMACKTLKKEIK